MFTSPASSHYDDAPNWVFGQASSPLSSTTTFGSQSYAGFGSSTSALGHSSSCNFGSSTGMSNSHGTSTWTFNQTSSPLSTPTTFGAPLSYSFGSLTSGGAKTTRSTFDFKQSHLGSQEQGSIVANYKRTPETEYSTEKLVSLSGMSIYQDKSHEELRWEDYKSTQKGGFGPSSFAVKSTSSGLSPFSSSPVTNYSTNSWGTTSVSTTPTEPNPFGKSFHSVATTTPTWNFPGPTSTSQPLPFSSSTNTSFKSPTFTSRGSTSPLWSLAPLNQNSFTNTFSFTSQPTQISSSAFSSPTFAPFIKPYSSSGFCSTPLVTTPATSVVSGSTFHQPTTLFQSFTNTSPSLSLSPLNQNPFTNPFTLPTIQTCSSSSAYPTSTSFTPGVVLNQPTTLFTPCVPSTQNYKEEITETSTDQLSSVIANPFGTLPPKSHLSFEGSPSTQSIQYGISNIPVTVKDKPAPVRYPLPTTRHLSRRNKLPVRKYDPKVNCSKVPYFTDNKEIPVSVFVPRENPRALVITRNIHEKDNSDSIYENEKDDIKTYASSHDPTKEKNKFPSVLNVPSKLQLPDYYTKPQISELEAKERSEPGFCSRVHDFVIGRHGYGSIRFFGVTDVRNLDLETYVQFNNREVIVYMDDTKKPPVGQGLNKPAEITLLNIKCIDKKTGVEYKDELKISKYGEMLKKKVVAQGGEFVSYDPVEGEWKFRVQNF